MLPQVGFNPPPLTQLQGFSSFKLQPLTELQADVHVYKVF